jgi:Domain of unknown function (DUF4263)
VPYPTALPGLREVAEQVAPEAPQWPEYEHRLMLAWRALLDSPEAQRERNLQEFLERHPCLIPGSHSDSSSHAPFPGAVITQPKLPGLTTRRPDFCWIARDSIMVYAVLIEIETPDKRWYHHEGNRRGELHGDLVHALGQIQRWKTWFSQPGNVITFQHHYRLAHILDYREFLQEYILIHGSRREFTDHPDLNPLRATLNSEDTTVMTFDRLLPIQESSKYACMKATERGYEVIAVPPRFAIGLHGFYNDSGGFYDDAAAPIHGFQEAITASEDIAAERRALLIETLRESRSESAERNALRQSGQWTGLTDAAGQPILRKTRQLDYRVSR